jgi:hypothetical protein
MWVVPVLLLFVIPNDRASERRLGDFSQFTTAIGAEISIVDREGVVREGLLTAASQEDVTMNFSGTPRTFPRHAVASGERLRDGTRDGALKGAIFGALLGVLTASDSRDFWMTSVAMFSGIGWAFDAAATNRQPFYKSTAPAGAGVKLSLRF